MYDGTKWLRVLMNVWLYTAIFVSSWVLAGFVFGVAIKAAKFGFELVP
jgi:hypothetical protein